MATYKHLRSSTANKRPTTSITDGQLAINTNTASPGLFFKDSAGTGIVKVGPVHVGTTAPNATPAAGGSSGNYLGEQWLDTSVSPAQMKVWNGSAWVGIVADELPVSKLQDGDARQLLQTDAAGTGVEWTSNVDVPGTLDVTSTATFDSIARHPLGSAAAPTLTFTGDPNTGIYSPGADQVAVATNGTGRLFVDASGNVGVGLTPASYAGYSVIGHGGTTGATLEQRVNGSLVGSLTTNTQVTLTSLTAIPIVLSTNNTERLRITSAGLVGIGSSSPAAQLNVSQSTGSSIVKLNGLNGYDLLISNTQDSGTLYDFSIGSSSGAFSFTTSAGERARIDSSGRLLVGTSTARSGGPYGTAGLQVESTSYSNASISAINNENTSDGVGLMLGKSRGSSIGSTTIVSSGDQVGGIYFQGADGSALRTAASIFAEIDGTPGSSDMPGRLVFSTTADGASSPTERMRIDSAGKILIAQTSTYAACNGQLNVTSNSATTAEPTFGLINPSATAAWVSFSDSVTVYGSITRSGSSTVYATSSDYRLKENVTPASDGITRLQQLKPSRFNFIADPDTVVDGFLAHEVQAIVPEAITGEKDAVDDEGNPVYQGIDQSKLVPLLTAALQEAIGEIESLKARLTAAGI